MTKQLRIQLVCMISAFSFCLTASAIDVPFVEEFETDAAHWVNFNSGQELSYNAAGGPDGSSYASTTYNFLNSLEGDSPVVVRGNSNSFGDSSDGAFFGDWIADGVGDLGLQVRHDADVPLSFFTRFAGPANFPGAIAIQFAPVLPNTWTQLGVRIGPGNPQFVSFEGQDFASVFNNVGRLQIGISVPAALQAADVDVTFEIDRVAVTPIPEPNTAALVLMGVAALGAGLRRRRQSRRVANESAN